MRNYAVIAALVVLCLCTVHVSAMYDDDDSDVINLSPDNFKDQVLLSDSPVMVEFYAPWCGHCKKLAPAYKKAATALKGKVIVAALDADAHKKLAAKYGIRGYPTIKMFPAQQTYEPFTNATSKQPRDFAGHPNAKSLVNEALRLIPDRVIKVTDDNVQDFLSQPQLPKILVATPKDSAPAVVKALSASLVGRARIGLCNLQENTAVARHFKAQQSKGVYLMTADGEVKALENTSPDSIKAFIVDGALSKDKEVADEMHEDDSVEELGDDMEKVISDHKGNFAVVFHKAGSGAAISRAKDLSEGWRRSVRWASLDCTRFASMCEGFELPGFPSIRLFSKTNVHDTEDLFPIPDARHDVAQWVIEKLQVKIVQYQASQQDLAMAMQSAVTNPLAMLFVKDDSVPDSFKAAAKQVSHKPLNFAVMINTNDQIIKQYQLKSMPGMMVFFSQNGTAEGLQGLPYQGRMAQSDLAGFFNMVLPDGAFDDNSASKKKKDTIKAGPAKEITTEQPFETVCGSTGLCVIAAFDGLEGQEAQEQKLEVLDTIRKKKSGPFRFAYVDATCHGEFMGGFNVNSGDLPTVVVVSPGRKRYTQLVGAYSEQSISEFLDDVMSGKKSTESFDQVQPLEQRPCAELLEEIRGGASGDSEEEDEIMREMREAAEREEAERKKQMAEAAKNSKSKKKKRGKKGRK